MALNPKDIFTRIEALQIALATRDFPLELRMADEGLEIWPNNPNLLGTKAFAFGARGQLDEAESILANVAFNPADPDAGSLARMSPDLAASRSGRCAQICRGPPAGDGRERSQVPDFLLGDSQGKRPARRTPRVPATPALATRSRRSLGRKPKIHTFSAPLCIRWPHSVSAKAHSRAGPTDHSPPEMRAAFQEHRGIYPPQSLRVPAKKARHRQPGAGSLTSALRRDLRSSPHAGDPTPGSGFRFVTGRSGLPKTAETDGERREGTTQ